MSDINNVAMDASRSGFITQVKLNRKLKEEINKLREELAHLKAENAELRFGSETGTTVAVANIEQPKQNNEEMQAILSELEKSEEIISKLKEENESIVAELKAENDELKSQMDEDLVKKNAILKENLRLAKAEIKKLNLEIVNVMKHNKDLMETHSVETQVIEKPVFNGVVNESEALNKMKLRFENIQKNYIAVVAERDELMAKLEAAETGSTGLKAANGIKETKINMA